MALKRGGLQMGEFCQLVEFHWEGFANNRASPASFSNCSMNINQIVVVLLLLLFRFVTTTLPTLDSEAG